MNNAMNGPLRLPDEYAGQWPSSSHAACVEKALALLKQSRKDMEQKGFSREQLKIIQRRLERMKRWLDLQRMAKEKVREGTRRVKGTFTHA